MNFKNVFSFICFCMFSLLSAQQNKILVSNIEEYNKAIKAATPDTNIILKNGIWKDVHFKVYGKGEKDKPIVIKAEKPGEVIISGDSKLQIYGEHIVVQGLWFKNGSPSSGNVVSFRKNDEQVANNCRFTHNTISYYNPDDKLKKSHWVELCGRNNRVDHNNFTGKTNKGTTLIVRLKDDLSDNNHHIIDANFFGERPKLGLNGGETIRIGTSSTSMKSSKTLVENNVFKACNGEVEIISNKSSDNIYRNNLFMSSEGCLTIRHGENVLVEGNVFLGNNNPKSGGVRVIGSGHNVRNNLMIGLKGKGNRAPITVMNGEENPALNGYFQVKDVSIQNNTLINCSPIEFSAQKSDKKSVPPTSTVFANNLISNDDGTAIYKNSDSIDGITFKNNIAETSSAVDTNYFTKETIEWELLQFIPIPKNTNTNLGSSYTNGESPKKDINGLVKDPFTVGAFNLGSLKYPKALRSKPGPYWKPKIIKPEPKPEVINVKPGEETLRKALKTVTGKSILKLTDGTYTFTKEAKIDGQVTIEGSENTILIAKDKLEKPFKSFFKILGGSSLTVKNLNFDGDNNTIKYAIISPSKDEILTYNLLVDNCSFKNFENSKGAVIKAYTNTLAESIIIKNSVFDSSFRGLNFHSKENTTQKVNAKNISIENTVFKNIEQYAIKYVYNGIDFTGNNQGNLNISNCIFNKVFDTEKGRVIDARNLKSTLIENSVFTNSYKIVNPINLKGFNNNVNNCLVSSCGLIKATKGAKAENIIYKSPKWDDNKKYIPSKKSPLLKRNNGIDDIGLKH